MSTDEESGALLEKNAAGSAGYGSDEDEVRQPSGSGINNSDGSASQSKYSTLAWLPLWAKLLIGAVAVTSLCVLIWYLVTYTFASTKSRKNVIFLISDGFGPASQTMARQYVQIMDSEPIGFQLPLDTILVGSSRTRSSDSPVTDSAAGATAFSCGLKSYNGAIGVDPEGKPCATILEALALIGYKTGLVATSRMTHATPASFSSHVVDRDMESEIALQEIGFTPLGVQPDVLFGGGLCFFIPNTTVASCRTDDTNAITLAEQNGYKVVYNAAELNDVPATAAGLHTLGLFWSSDMPYEIDRNPATTPSLYDMATKALSILTDAVDQDSSSPGFFIMIEGSRIDHAAHDNDAASHLGEILMYNKVVDYVKSYVDQHPDTIIVSTSDHECGGFTVARQVFGGDADYIWYPQVLSKVTNSTGILATDLKAFNTANPDDLAEIGAYINLTVVNNLGITDMTNVEYSTILNYTTTSAVATADLNYYLNNMVNVRAQLGWTTHGHSAVDVNLYAYGDESVISAIRGNRENTDIGVFFQQHYGVDLAPLTERLNAPSTSSFTTRGRRNNIPDEYHSTI